jgi:hypothetical protein
VSIVSAVRDRGRLWIWGAIAAAALGAVLWVVIAGGEEERVDEPELPASSLEPAEPRSPGRARSAGEGERAAPDENDGPSAAERRRRAERAAVRRATQAYRSYVAAINERDGETICARIEPGFLPRLRPPVGRGSCADRIGGSIGFADERGFPVWEETILSGVESVRTLGDERVRLTAAVVTRFADRDQPSVESDIAYLVRDGGRGFRLAQPTGALWRAIGKPDVPPQAIAAPPGF